MNIDFSGVPWFWLMIFFAFVVMPAIRGNGRGSKRELGLASTELDRSRREIATLRSELDERMTDVDLLSTRVAELENRLDFTERLLAQHRPAASARDEASLQ